MITRGCGCFLIGLALIVGIVIGISNYQNRRLETVTKRALATATAAQQAKNQAENQAIIELQSTELAAVRTQSAFDIVVVGDTGKAGIKAVRDVGIAAAASSAFSTMINGLIVIVLVGFCLFLVIKLLGG